MKRDAAVRSTCRPRSASTTPTSSRSRSTSRRTRRTRAPSAPSASSAGKSWTNRPEEGRIEATDTTRFFGFKDDIVVRIRPVNGGARVDVRSKSRVGLGDAGTNAKRVREFLERMRRA